MIRFVAWDRKHPPAGPRPPRAGWRIFLGCMVAMVIGLSSIAEACNSLRFRNLGAQVTWQGGSGSGYEVFDSGQTVQAVTFDIRKSGPTGCNYFVVISVGGNGTFSRQLSGSGNTLEYNFYTSAALSSVVKDVPTATSSEIISGSFSGAGTQDASHTVQVNIPPLQVVPPGRFTCAFHAGFARCR